MLGGDRGDQIVPSLIEAVHDSSTSIIIITPDCASSHRCLEDLAKIGDCEKLILPVLYDNLLSYPIRDSLLTNEQLKTTLKSERKALNALYQELEEERSASADIVKYSSCNFSDS
ncbi:hypothetical protein K1719_021808 [Acacia pycnantha]|nr:hypothetical protein K1719_021808 [Acacia pycnantha]